jgi:hypothetical protein
MVLEALDLHAIPAVQFRRQSDDSAKLAEADDCALQENVLELFYTGFTLYGSTKFRIALSSPRCPAHSRSEQNTQ